MEDSFCKRHRKSRGFSRHVTPDTDGGQSGVPVMRRIGR
jgi:hypothetical protein